MNPIIQVTMFLVPCHRVSRRVFKILDNGIQKIGVTPNVL